MLQGALGVTILFTLSAVLSLLFGVFSGKRDISKMVTFLQLVIAGCVAINLRDVRQSQLYWRMQRSTMGTKNIRETPSSPMQRVDEDEVEENGFHNNYLDDDDENEVRGGEERLTEGWSVATAAYHPAI